MFNFVVREIDFLERGCFVKKFGGREVKKRK